MKESMKGVERADGLHLSRRQFVALSAGAGAALVAGCATNPVTGKSQFMLMSEAQEVKMDQQYAPHQFSFDFGAAQDAKLNAYLVQLGNDMAKRSHRPNMPYNFRVLNTVVVNGYTMPAGSVGLARGLMLMMENEAQLAGVVGHEIGHVCYRHAGERMSKQMATTALVAAVGAYLEYEKKEYAAIATGLGMVGANMLLCRYSRDDEREADEIGMEYMVRAGHNPNGMIGLMDGFQKLHKSKPGLVEVLFSTHPMSDERYKTAMARVKSKYGGTGDMPVNRERYMDNIASIRAIRPAIEKMQEGDAALAKNKAGEAESKYREALNIAPDDYAGLLSMARCCLVQKKFGDARQFAEKAKAVYPQEPQAKHICGVSKVACGQFDSALQDFTWYEQHLPGNSNTTYFKGLCHDKMGNRKPAAEHYQRYLQQDGKGEFANSARQRLVSWGYYVAPQ